MMKTHIQLLWQSIFAPRAAVDLARQHPNPLKLGLTYLFAICFVSIALEYARPAIVQPLQLPESNELQNSSWLDMPFYAGLFSVFYYLLSFGFALWFWRKIAPGDLTTDSVQAVVAVSFANALALLVPFDLLFEFFENSSFWWLSVITLVFIVVSLALSTIYSSYGFKLSTMKSFWLNVLCYGSVFIFFVAAMFGIFAFEGGL